MLRIKKLGLKDYESVWQAMREFTDNRTDDSADEIWVVEHQPVFTQGQAGKPEHLIATGDIPVVQTDRGGQVTYHGPGQLVVYPLLNLKRLKLGVRELVTRIENSVVEFLKTYEIESAAKADAPGVYVDNNKIASLGLRVRRGCSFHGVSININMDMSPFLRINPCGYAQMQMVQLAELTQQPKIQVDDVADAYIEALCQQLNVSKGDIN